MHFQIVGESFEKRISGEEINTKERLEGIKNKNILLSIVYFY